MINLQKYHLEIISSVFKNIASAFIFAALFARDIYLLTQSILSAILLLGVIVAIERKLSKL